MNQLIHRKCGGKHGQVGLKSYKRGGFYFQLYGETPGLANELSHGLMDLRITSLEPLILAKRCPFIYMYIAALIGIHLIEERLN